MKKQLLLILITFSLSVTAFCQAAPDFTATDCNGNSHNLYAELNNGKVIVLVWVEPCFSCVGPSLTAYNIVQSYSSPNVLYYLIDDAGNTPCTALSSWASGYGIGSNRTTFSTSAIVETNYGSVGMPHIVVVGTSQHTIYFNQINAEAGNASGIQNAINTALAAVASVPENIIPPFQWSLSSEKEKITVEYTLDKTSAIELQIVNALGKMIRVKNVGRQTIGNYSCDFYLENIETGVYFMRFISDGRSKVVRFYVSH